MRTISIAVICFGYGLLSPPILRLLDDMPLTSSIEILPTDPPSSLRVLAILTALIVVGVVDGRLNPHIHLVQRTRWWTQSIVCAVLSVTVGMLYAMWPIAENELFVRLGQIAIAAGGSAGCLALSHIAVHRPRRVKGITC